MPWDGLPLPLLQVYFALKKIPPPNMPYIKLNLSLLGHAPSVRAQAQSLFPERSRTSIFLAPFDGSSSGMPWRRLNPLLQLWLGSCSRWLSIPDQVKQNTAPACVVGRWGKRLGESTRGTSIG